MRYYFEYIIFVMMMGLFGAMGLDRASAFGGFLGRMLGPRTSLHQRAKRHLCLAFPDMKDQQRRTILKDMWDNLGRVFAEYPYLEDIVKNRVTIAQSDIFKEIANDENAGPAVFVSAHTGNWEISGLAILEAFNIKISPIYRAPNNPHIDKIIASYRSAGGKLNAFEKSTKGTREMLKALRNTENIAILADQKYNQGISCQFFGRPAKTSTAPAELALKFKCPLIASVIIRTKGANFELRAQHLLDPQTNQTPTGITPLTQHIQDWIEQQIRQTPSQWLWVHRRWGKI